MESIVTKRKIAALILVWIFLTSTAPFIFFRWPGHPYKILTFFCLSAMVFQMAMYKKNKIYDFTIFAILLAQISYYIIVVVCYNDYSSLNLVLQLVSLFILISYIRCFIGFKLMAKSFILIMIGMGIGGTFIFFVHIIRGLEPIFTVSYGGDMSYFLGLTTTNVFIDVGNIRILRYSGFFDEPGTFALFATFALVVNKIYFNNKKHELLLILLTLFTFSVAFYFSIVFYLLFFYFNRSTIYYLIAFIIVLPLLFIIIEKIDLDIYGKIVSMTIERFDETQTDLASTNRGELMAHDYKAFIENPIFGVGPGPEKVAGSNVYAIVAKYGLVGSLFFYSFLVYMVGLVFKMRYNKKIKYFKVLFIILLSLFHRPELSSVFTLIIFYVIIYNMRYYIEIPELNPTNRPSIT